MPKKIIITLNDRAAQYFAEVQYSLDKGDGKTTTKSDVINHCLEELSLFENFTDDQLTNWLMENYSAKYEKFLEEIKSRSVKI
jgi:hypothetical protein